MTESYEIDWLGMRVEIWGTFKRGESAPRCSNHDDPRFSDPGSAPEIEIEKAYFIFMLGEKMVRLPLSQEILAMIDDETVAEQIW